MGRERAVTNIGQLSSLLLIVRLALLPVATGASSMISPTTVYGAVAEVPPTFHAADILPEHLLRGPGWTLRAEVASDGMTNTYVIDHEAGQLTVQSTALLEIRAHELSALAGLEEVAAAQVAGEAALNAAKSPFIFAKDLVTSPVDTAEDVAEGTGRFFSGIGRAVFGAKGEEEEGVVGATLGTAAAKRGFAREFQVDPYAENALLQDRLTELAWSTFAGGVAVSAAVSGVTGSGSNVASTFSMTKFAEGMTEIIYDLQPSELYDVNREKLIGMQIDERAIDLFLDHPNFSPSRETFFVGALDLMDGVRNRGLHLDRALACDSVADAFLWQRVTEMFAAYHTKVEPVTELFAPGTLPFLVTASSKLIGILPNDHLVWTEALASGVEDARFEHAPEGERELWLAGTISDKAREQLEAIGWTIYENKQRELSL